MRNIFKKIILSIILLLYSNSEAIGQNFHVVEIDSVEYNNAKCGFEKTYQFLSPTRDNEEMRNQFLYNIVSQDEKARDIYIDEIVSNGYISHEFFCVHGYDGIINHLLFLDFETPVESFTYISSIIYQEDMMPQSISISYKCIDSAPLVMSNDGFIAGFKEDNDAYYVDFKIYKIDLDENGELSINELFAYESTESRPWRTSNYPFSIFWMDGILYISGYALEYEGEIRFSPSHEVPCFYKVEIE